MYTHIIFDLDGTLLNTIDDLADAGNHVCAAHGWPVHTVDAYKRMVGNGIPNLVSRFTPDWLGEDELAGALAEFSAYYNDHKADKTAPYPGIPELLAALKGAGIHMAVLSNKAHALAGPVVEHYFPGVFEYVQGALPDAPLKPDPTLLHAMMKEIGAKPETTLFVGDSDVDVHTGKNGGLTVVGVLWGFRDRPELEGAGADYVIERPGQLLNSGPDQNAQARRRAVGGEDVAETGSVIRCVLCWLATAFFALLELADLWWLFKLLPDVLRYGYDWEAGYNLHLAEDFEIAGALASFLGVPLLLLLPLSILLARKLPKRSRLTVGCTVCWPVAVVLAFFEYLFCSYLVQHLPDVLDPDYDGVYYLVENCREIAVQAVLTGITLLVMLALAVYCTIKLGKRGTQREHSISDK